MIHKISFAVFFQNQQQSYSLICLDDPFYYILATEYMINSKLQPLACYRSGKGTYYLPFLSSIVSWLAVWEHKERYLLSYVPPRIYCQLKKRDKVSGVCFFSSLCFLYLVLLLALQSSWLSSVEATTVATQKAMPR